MKKIIFVGGTSYSGSTALHLMLANDPNGFACGELDTLFYPKNSGHVKRMRLCDQRGRRLWADILDHGPKSAYIRIFELFPEIQFIVDSSKNPFWIKSQGRSLLREGVSIHNIVIWKTPLDFAYSRKRREELDGWDNAWVRYHRLYMSLIGAWRSVSYKNLALNNSEALRASCRILDIPYFPEKEKFWEKEQMYLGGNHSTRIHFTPSEMAESYEGRWIDSGHASVHRSVYYKPVQDSALVTSVDDVVRKSRHLKPIEEVLMGRDVMAMDPSEIETLERLKLSSSEVVGRHLFGTYRNVFGRLRFGRGVQDSLEAP